jgi:hypothetical protein
LRNLPYEDLSIIGAGRNYAIVERVPSSVSSDRWRCRQRIPVSIQNRRSVSTEKRDLFWESPFLIDWNDSECASSAGFPIDREVFWIGLSQSAPCPAICFSDADLYEVGIPRIAADMEIIVSRFLSRRLAKHMSCSPSAGNKLLCGGTHDISTRAPIEDQKGFL